MTNSTTRSQTSPTSVLLQWAPLALNISLLGVLVWHVAFEAVPSAIEHSHQLAGAVDRGLSWMPLLPYLALGVWIARAPQSLKKWRYAAVIVFTVLVYAALAVARFFLVHRDFLPAN